jgi:phospholipid/cholesterol/gamma-HCH transport system substrate-binding protein
MKRDNINYLAAGAVVVATLALLFAVLYKITGRTGDTDPYHVYYQHVAGLRYGTAVFYDGYRIGQIEAVTPEREGAQTRFRIDLSVEQGWPIPDDSIAEITTSGLLSDVFIVLNEGRSDQLLSPDAEIRGQEAGDIFAALGGLAQRIETLTESELGPLLRMVNERVDDITGDLANDTPLIVAQIRELVTKLNGAAGSVEEIVGEENQQYLSSTLKNVDTLSASAATLVNDLHTSRAELQSLVTELNELAKDNRPGVQNIIQDLEATTADVSDRLREIGFNLDEAARNLNEFARAIRMRPNRLIFAPDADQVEESP